jgi:hypothetical protein
VKNREQSLIRIVAKISLWATPIPSSYFVARASVKSLQVESPFHIVIAGVVELLGVSAVHVFLWIYTWNRNNVTDAGNPKQVNRKPIPLASRIEFLLSGTSAIIYFVSVTVLIALLEKQFVYVMFPAMTLTAAINLSLIANQESRESQTGTLQTDKKPSTKTDKRLTPTLHIVDNGRQGMKQARKEVLLTLLQSNSQLGASEAGRMIGVSRQAIYGYLSELESDGLIERTTEGIIVK